MVVIARIQSYGAVFAGIDILQNKSQFLRKKWNIDEVRKVVRWLRLRGNKKSRNLTFTYIDPPLLRQHYFCELHNS